MTPIRRIQYAPARLALRLVSARGVQMDRLLELPPEGRGMAQALALGEAQVGAARWQAADRCRIAWRGDEWLLSNHSRRLVCALNGRRIATGEQTILEVGDMLELDLLRFHVVEHEPGGRRVNPFEEMQIGSAEIGLSASNTSDRKFDLLGLLHEEFFVAVQDPTRLFGKADWIAVQSTSETSAPTLEELSTEAAPYTLLRDILLAKAPIDTVIGSFDDFGQVDLAHREVESDVLRLFAIGIAHPSASRLPELTRREHHAWSIDSAIAIGKVRPGDDKVSA